MGVLDLTCYDIECLLDVHELSTEDDGEPRNRLSRTLRDNLCNKANVPQWQ
jgi:hypothetical protein